jgi:hypothetical protein
VGGFADSRHETGGNCEKHGMVHVRVCLFSKFSVYSVIGVFGRRGKEGERGEKRETIK